MKAARHILLVCGLTAEPQPAMGHSTLDLRVLPSVFFLRGGVSLVESQK
jgi:hypothetical protein